MANYNKVTLIGTLTRDPEIKYTPKGTAITDIGLAINRTWKNDSGEKMEDVTFVDVTLCGRVAEIVGEYCKKGKPLFVEGRLQLDQWDDKATGQKRSKLKVIGENIQLLGSKDAGQRDEPQGPPRERERQRPAGLPQRPPRPPADPDLDAPEDDFPI